MKAFFLQAVCLAAERVLLLNGFQRKFINCIKFIQKRQADSLQDGLFCMWDEVKSAAERKQRTAHGDGEHRKINAQYGDSLGNCADYQYFIQHCGQNLYRTY